MSEQEEDLEGICAVIYTALWQTRELGFLKQVLTDLKIKKLKLLFYIEDYMPGALLTLDGIAGDFKVDPMDTIDGVEYDGAFIGKLKPLIKAMEKHSILRLLGVVLSRKVKLKGKLKLLKFGRILLKGAL